MRWICAWCEQAIPPPENAPSSEQAVSHGICSGCVKNLLDTDGLPLEDFLDQLNVPVLLVDADVRVQSFNRAAGKALGKPPAEVLAHLGGTVFDCAFARLPGGCGHTVHCSGCAIRLAVNHTYQTGEPQFEVPATLAHPADSAADAALQITTFKSGELVALHIKGMS